MIDGQVIGIDLGGTQIKAAAFSVSPFRPLRQIVRPTLDGERERNLPRWAVTIREMVAELERECGTAARVGLCAPGLASPDGRCIAHMPDRMQGLEGFDWTTHLQRSEPVRVLNDAHASLLGEVQGGVARNLRNVYLLTLGTGVGGAAMVDGHLLRGHLGRAGHLGHVCLDVDGTADITKTPGSLEDCIGDHNVGARSAGRFNSTRALVEAFAAGDPEAARVWLRSIRALACAIASLNNVLDPEAVILGGGITAAGRHLFGPLQAELEKVEWRPLGGGVVLLQAQLGDWAGAWGSAIHAGSVPTMYS